MAREPESASGEAEVVAYRELAARSVLFQQAVAERLGLNETDQRCFALLIGDAGSGALNAGRLAELTGLTTGAITGVLDRLERSGFVRREKSAEDRRQLQIRVLPERLHEYSELHAPLVRSLLELSAQLSPEQRALVRTFMDDAARLLHDETERLRGQHGAATSPAPNELSSPLGQAREGRFELNRGASNLSIGSLRGGLLYRLRHAGPAPQVEARDGHVHVAYNRGALRLFDFRKHALQVDLSERVAWEIVLRGGVQKCEADLRALRLVSMDLRGGAENAAFALPAPVGHVHVRIAGGASHMRLLRPAQTPARIHISGGVSHLTIDTMELGAVGGTMRWESPDFESSKDRYEIQVSGGASHLHITGE